MSYVPNPTDATQPTDLVDASTMAAEFRALKAYANSIVAAGLPPLTGNAGATLSVNEAGTAAIWTTQATTIRSFELFV